MQVLDPDTLQSMDENNKRWVKDWREAVSKLAYASPLSSTIFWCRK
jgi:hypothetical protein